MDPLVPKDHGEAVAVFRNQVIGALICRQLVRGELRAAIDELSGQRFRPPAADHTRTFSRPTLERWFYAFRRGGIVALRPKTRSDRGRARELTAEQRDLLLDVRREHPSASAALIVRTLVADGRLEKGAISEATVRRFYAEHGLDRVPLRAGRGAHTRLRWEAERPMALWHGDVCHGPALVIDGVSRPLRIHALLDDAARYVVAIEALHAEREIDMLGLMVKALRRFGKPDALYLDNGPIYSGETLRTACARLGIALLHAKPYDAQARGKMERFWRSLRQGCLDHLGSLSSLHDVQVRLLAFLDQHYHRAPHGGLMGRTPNGVWANAWERRDAMDEICDTLTDDNLRDALTVRDRRRVRRDTTISVAGRDWELDQGFLAGRIVTVARSLLDPAEAPWIEHEGKRLALRPVDPRANSGRKRPPRRPGAPTEPVRHVPFDPAGALLDQAAGRKPEHGGAR